MSTNSQYPPHPHPDTYSSPPFSVVLTVCLLVFFFVAFFSVYYCRCFIDNVLHTRNLRRSPSGNLVSSSNAPNNPGLDPSLKQLFPTITYSSVKNFGREQCGLECAICLAEFNDDDFLRVLTVCCHVFHQECIDLWLESHKTCPVCRANLDLPQETLAKCPILVHDNTIHDISEGNGSSDDAMSIVIKDDVDDGRRVRSEQGASPNTMQQNERRENMERFSRSHSTGHSIVWRTGEEEDRYTLRLPEYVKIKITRGHDWANSCVTFGDFSNPTVIGNGGFGEVSGSSGGDINKV